VLADIGSGDLFWSILWLFFLFIWIMILIQIFGDLFRDHELSGGVKALWCIFLIFLPFLAIFIYLITRGKGMAERSLKAQQEMQAQFAQYVQQTAGAGSPTEQISQAKALLDAGTISQAEFDAIKAKAIS
jgi:hypothetical protein